MSELRLKIRNKIYTSGNHIIDTTNKNNAIIVFLGKMSSETLKPYVENFMKDTLKSQIPDKRICYVVIDEDSTEKLTEKIEHAVRNIEFSSAIENDLFISFVTLMDDDIYKNVQKIDVNAIESLKVSALGGYSVEFFYNFYGIFTSTAKYENRLNARKTILDFLDKNNGEVNTVKRIFHQACPGNDFYRSAKSITFMILSTLIGKLDAHLLAGNEVKDDCYTWTTFSFYEKNLASLVIYEMVNKLITKQATGTEAISTENVIQSIKDEFASIEAGLKNAASSHDINYIPIIVRKIERNLTFIDKIKNIFLKDKIKNVEFMKIDEDLSVNALLEQQSEVMEEYVDKNITDDYINDFLIKLINMCSVMNSIIGRESLIMESLDLYKKELETEASSYRAPSEINDSIDYYVPKYNNLILRTKISAIKKIIEYFEQKMGSYVENIQNHWNAMNMEANDLVNDFAVFHDYFAGIGDLILDKSISLMSSYDDILEKIDVNSVVRTINKNNEIFSNVIASYFDNVKVAGDIAKRFGNCNIVPNIEATAYTLFSNENVGCPDGLKLVNDEHWFRDHEIAILFTAKNKIEDCNNLPFGN